MALKKQHQDKQITRFGTASQISTARKHRDELLKLIASIKTGRDAAHFEEFVENLEWEAMRMLPYATARPEAAEQAQRDYDAAVAEWEGENEESSEDETTPPPPPKKKISKRVIEDSEDEDDTCTKRASKKTAAKKTTTTTTKGKALATPKKSALKEVTNTVKEPRGKKRSLDDDEDDDAAGKVVPSPKKAKKLR